MGIRKKEEWRGKKQLRREKREWFDTGKIRRKNKGFRKRSQLLWMHSEK